MQANPLVSIIMPIYNVENYIEKSVKSVIDQSYKNIELILVDDGSPDRSVQIAEKVLKEHSYPYKLIHQENGGIGEARNTGIKNSTGDWILFLDSDDTILKNTVADLAKAINENVDLIFSKFKVVKSQNSIKQSINGEKVKVFTPEQIQKNFLTRKYVILVAGTLFRRELLVDKGIFFEKIRWSEDQHFIWRLLSVIKSAVYIDKVLYLYLNRPGSIMTSSSIAKIIESYPQICKLPEFYNNNLFITRFLVPRWVLGTISSAAKISNFSDWLSLYKNLNAKEHMKTLLHFPSITAKIRVFVCLVSKKAYYNFFAKRT